MGFKTKIKQLTSGNVEYGKVLIADGNSGFTFTDMSIPSGTTFPSSPTGGTMYYRTDVDLLFYYDGSRSKWFTVDGSTLSCGRTSATAGGTIYLRVGDASMTSTSGFRMFRNGTIVGASANNDDVLTEQSHDTS